MRDNQVCGSSQGVAIVGDAHDSGFADLEMLLGHLELGTLAIAQTCFFAQLLLELLSLVLAETSAEVLDFVFKLCDSELLF